METTVDNVDAFTKLIEMLPLWGWQIIGAFFITMMSMQIIKLFEPGSWSPYRRRKINLALSIVIGGGSIAYLYDQGAKEFVIVAFMLGNNFLYTGLARLVEHKAKKDNGIWTVINGFFRPHLKRRQTYLEKSGDVIKEKDIDTDSTVRLHVVKEDNHAE